MLGGILRFILVVAVLFGAGFLSYTYLEQTTAVEENHPIVDVKRVSVVLNTATTTTAANRSA